MFILSDLLKALGVVTFELALRALRTAVFVNSPRLLSSVIAMLGCVMRLVVVCFGASIVIVLNCLDWLTGLIDLCTLGVMTLDAAKFVFNRSRNCYFFFSRLRRSFWEMIWLSTVALITLGLRQ